MSLPVGGSEFPVFEMSHGLTVFLACISNQYIKKIRATSYMYMYIYISD